MGGPAEAAGRKRPVRTGDGEPGMPAAAICRAQQRLWPTGLSAPGTERRDCAKRWRRGWAWGGLGGVMGVMACVLIAQPTEAGNCVRPPKGSTAFCEVSHQVYVSSDTMQNDTDYWFQLDKQAEDLTEQWNENMGCSKSVLSGESWCKNYACGVYFPKCTSFKDAPLPVCRQTCIDCFRTCTPDRPILPPGMYYPPGFAGNDDKSWGKQYTNVRYDAWTKAYICEADHKLVDGGQFLFLSFGSPCTGEGIKLQRPHWAMYFLLCAVALVAYYQRA